MSREKVPLYAIHDLKEGTFLSRPNRFVAEIKYEGKRETAHVHDPGRLTELLIPGTRVLFNNSNGKLKYYIRAVKTKPEWVLLDTAQHSKIARMLFGIMPEFTKFKNIKAEVPIGKSRIDFTLDEVPLEVKGVSLVIDGLGLFPDAPTKRGTRHVREIIKHDGMIFFLVFRKAREFAPNAEMDPEFAEALKEARASGIPIYTAQLSFDGKTIYYEGTVKLTDF